MAHPLLTMDQYFKREAPPSTTVEDHARELLDKVNRLFDEWPGLLHITSGYRPPAFNATVKGAAPNSKHTTGQAIDLRDPYHELALYVFRRQDRLMSYGLYVEDPRATPTWLHLQCSPPRSGRRFFHPTLASAQAHPEPLTLAVVEALVDNARPRLDI